VNNSSPVPGNRPSLLPAIIGISIAGALVLVLGFWIAGRPPAGDRRPDVRILAPSSDTTSDGRLLLEFETSQPLELQPTGWGTGRFHLHALVNGVERMPAANDIQARPRGNYSWLLSDLPDSAVVQLVWALPSHQRLTEGSSETRVVRRRPR
jgi:hypothetical protein